MAKRNLQNSFKNEIVMTLGIILEKWGLQGLKKSLLEKLMEKLF